MYGAFWNALPGPWPVKLLILLVVIAAILVALVAWVFPWIDGIISPAPDVTVGMAQLQHPA